MPPKKVIAAKKATKPIKAVAKGKKVTKPEDVKIETAADIFTTISTKVPLQAGVCIVRPLGDDKYEIVSLEKVPQGLIGSEDAAELVESVPERKAALEVSEEQWKSVKLKCDAVIRATGKGIFRFFKLPVELRFKIYKLVVFNPEGIRLRTWGQRYITASNGCQLMLASRLFYEECSQFYYQNNFRIEHKPIVKLRTMPNLVEKLQEVQFDWWYKYSDAKCMSDIARFPNLRVLNLSMIHAYLSFLDSNLRGNRLFRDESSVKKFNNLPGFDTLVSMRGLKLVTFKLTGLQGLLEAKKKEVEADAKVFEDFLNRELTQPRVAPAPKVSLSRTAKGKAKTSMAEEESEEEIYIPRNTKTRAARQIVEESDSDFDAEDEDDE